MEIIGASSKEPSARSNEVLTETESKCEPLNEEIELWFVDDLESSAVDTAFHIVDRQTNTRRPD